MAVSGCQSLLQPVHEIPHMFSPKIGSRHSKVPGRRRRTSLERMRSTDFVGYILAALRNAAVTDQREREEAAHDVIVYLLVSPGQLFAGYDAETARRLVAVVFILLAGWLAAGGLGLPEGGRLDVGTDPHCEA